MDLNAQDLLGVIPEWWKYLFGFGTLGSASWWLIKLTRGRQIRPEIDKYPFQVVRPGSEDVQKQILRGRDDDYPLDAHKIPYQRRVQGREIQTELEEALDQDRWLLIVGPTGIGKTREAAELAAKLNRLGWTILIYDSGWLDVPPSPPTDHIGTDKQILILIDDLNQKVDRLRDQSPKVKEDPFQPIYVPFQDRLLRTLQGYEGFYRAEQIRVIATARNEPEEWKKLQIEAYPGLWNRFKTFDLPLPEDRAIVDLLTDTVPQAEVRAESAEYLTFAQRNDRTFQNMLLNLQRVREEQSALSLDGFRETLKGSWQQRYQEVIERFPVARYIYDGIDLLRSLGVDLYRFTVVEAAVLIAGGNFLQRWRCRSQINRALDDLIPVERILDPRDGQIEGKEYEIQSRDYIEQLVDRMLRLADRYPQELFRSLRQLAINVQDRDEDAIRITGKALQVDPQNDLAWILWGIRGTALQNQGQLEAAIDSYDQALHYKPDKHEAWNNRGNALQNQGQLEAAIDSYDQALHYKPDKHEAWFNRGTALVALDRYDEAIDSFNQAQIYPSDLSSLMLQMRLNLSTRLHQENQIPTDLAARLAGISEPEFLNSLASLTPDPSEDQAQAPSPDPSQKESLIPQTDQGIEDLSPTDRSDQSTSG